MGRVTGRDEATFVTFARVAADLKGARYREEWRSSWAIALLYRVPGLPLVWLLARTPVTPMGLTLAALLLALALPGLAWGLPLGAAAVAVAAGGALFQVLDCADGTLARVTGRSSRGGGDADFLVDMAQWGLLYIAIGLLADRTLGTGGGWTALAAAAAWGRLLARVISDRLKGFGGGGSRPLRPLDYLPAFVAGLSGLIPFLALSGPWLGWAVLALVVYSLLDIGDALGPSVARALRRGRG